MFKSKKFILLSLLVLILAVGGILSVQAETPEMYLWRFEDNEIDSISGLNFNTDYMEYVNGPENIANSKAVDLQFGSYGYTEGISSDSLNFTVSLWVYMPAGASVWQPFFTTGLLGDSDFIDLFAYVENDEVNLRFSLGNALDMYYVLEDGSDRVAAEEWHHMAVTYDNDTTLAKLYYNGAKICEYTVDSAKSGWAGLSDTVVYVGYEAKNSIKGSGVIDEILFSHSILSDDEIKALYENPLDAAAGYISQHYIPTPVPTATPEPTPVPTPAPTPEATEVPDEPTAVPGDNEDKGDEPSEEKEGGSNVGIIIGIAAAVIVIAVVVVVIIKKKGN